MQTIASATSTPAVYEDLQVSRPAREIEAFGLVRQARKNSNGFHDEELNLSVLSYGNLGAAAMPQNSRWKAIHELAVSHRNLGEGVGLMRDASHFVSGMLTTNLAEILLSNVKAVGDLLTSFPYDLQRRLVNWNDQSTVVGDLLACRCLRMNEIYSGFYRTAVSVVSSLEETNGLLKDELSRLAADDRPIISTGQTSEPDADLGVNARLMHHLLHFPAQTIRRCHKIWSGVREETPREHPDAVLLDEGLEGLACILDAVLKIVKPTEAEAPPVLAMGKARKTKREMEGLRAIIKGLDSLEKPGQRCLVSHGEVCLMNTKKRYHLILFNDLIALANLTEKTDDMESSRWVMTARYIVKACLLSYYPG